MNCIFCKIVNGEIPAYKIYEDEEILAFLDVNPVSPGHTLIIPKKHTLDITTIDDVVLIKILDKSRDISQILINKLGAQGFTLVQNNGSVQEVKHFHLHVMPKYNRKKKLSLEEVHKLMTN